MTRRRWWVAVRVAAILGCLTVVAWLHHAWTELHRPPRERLAPGTTYREMPPDARHRYIDVPLDHDDPARGSFREFYILSPHFVPGGPVIFFFTDGQMELVDTTPDEAFFESQLPGLSYVLVGHRGHAPTQLPEVYPNGRLDRGEALRLYGSPQRVEDLEDVRRDMAAHGLLPADGRIMIYGASGAGVLAQQYVARYGEHVSRVLLSVTGAPDLARRAGVDYGRDFRELDPEAADELRRVLERPGVDRARLSYLLFQLGREGLAGRATQRRVIHALATGHHLSYWWQSLRPSLSWPLARVLLSGTEADAAKVRMLELLGDDLRRYGTRPPADLHLLYEWTAVVLADALARGPMPPPIAIDRSRFAGEVLVISAADDVVFSPEVGRRIAAAYRDARFLYVRGGHRLEDDRDYHAALRRDFFVHGLHSTELQTRLAGAPRP